MKKLLPTFSYLIDMSDSALAHLRNLTPISLIWSMGVYGIINLNFTQIDFETIFKTGFALITCFIALMTTILNILSFLKHSLDNIIKDKQDFFEQFKSLSTRQDMTKFILSSVFVICTSFILFITVGISVYQLNKFFINVDG